MRRGKRLTQFQPDLVRTNATARRCTMMACGILIVENAPLEVYNFYNCMSLKVEIHWRCVYFGFDLVNASAKLEFCNVSKDFLTKQNNLVQPAYNLFCTFCPKVLHYQVQDVYQGCIFQLINIHISCIFIHVYRMKRHWK